MKQIKRALLAPPTLVALLLPACGSSETDASAAAKQPAPEAVAALGIRNEANPLPGVYTAGQPTEAQFDELAALGVWMINLRQPTENGTGWEEERATEKNAHFERLVIDGADGLTADNAKKLAAAMERAGDAPVIVTCGSSNRVGALIALKAHFVDGEDAAKALELGRAAGVTRLEEPLKKVLGL